MALAGTEIRKALDAGVWTAWRGREAIGAADLTIGPNSVDLTLHRKLFSVYCLEGGIDPRDPDTLNCECASLLESGFILYPRRLYLAAVNERFKCTAPVLDQHFYPVIDGRSTMGRIGLSVHVTAGRGDFGFAGQFTLEITVTLPVRVYPGMRIAQLYFEPIQGVPELYAGAYQEQEDGPRLPVLGVGRV
jgi:dCTP deaminase